MFFNQVFAVFIFESREGNEEQFTLREEDDMSVGVSRQEVGNGFNQQLIQLL
jgi:hypothetical protein